MTRVQNQMNQTPIMIQMAHCPRTMNVKHSMDKAEVIYYSSCFYYSGNEQHKYYCCFKRCQKCVAIP